VIYCLFLILLSKSIRGSKAAGFPPFLSGGTDKILRISNSVNGCATTFLFFFLTRSKNGKTQRNPRFGRPAADTIINQPGIEGIAIFRRILPRLRKIRREAMLAKKIPNGPQKRRASAPSI
jgi:hypothetical protein